MAALKLFELSLNEKLNEYAYDAQVRMYSLFLASFICGSFDSAVVARQVYCWLCFFLVAAGFVCCCRCINICFVRVFILCFDGRQAVNVLILSIYRDVKHAVILGVLFPPVLFFFERKLLNTVVRCPSEVVGGPARIPHSQLVLSLSYSSPNGRRTCDFSDFRRLSAFPPTLLRAIAVISMLVRSIWMFSRVYGGVFPLPSDAC